MNDRERLSLFLGLEPARDVSPTPATLSRDLGALCCAYGLGLAVTLGVIVDPEDSAQEAEAHGPRRLGRPDAEGSMNAYYLVAAFLLWFFLIGSLIKLPKA